MNTSHASTLALFQTLVGDWMPIKWCSLSATTLMLWANLSTLVAKPQCRLGWAKIKSWGPFAAADHLLVFQTVPPLLPEQQTKATAGDNASLNADLSHMQQDESRCIEVEVQSGYVLLWFLVTCAALSGRRCLALTPYFLAIICQAETQFPVKMMWLDVDGKCMAVWNKVLSWYFLSVSPQMSIVFLM